MGNDPPMIVAKQLANSLKSIINGQLYSSHETVYSLVPSHDNFFFDKNRPGNEAINSAALRYRGTKKLYDIKLLYSLPAHYSVQFYGT